jgi:hypothetical protein
VKVRAAFHTQRETNAADINGKSRMSALGHLRPMRPPPTPTNVRFFSNSDQNIALQ